MDNASNVSAESGTPATLDTKRWKPLRIWPPIIFLAGMVVFRYLPSSLEDPPTWIWMSAAFGPAICGILILIWWIAASRATIAERIVGFLGVILAATLTFVLIDKTMLGPAIPVLVIPLGMVSFAFGAIACHRILSFKRTIVALVMACVGFGVSTLVRSDGLWGNFALTLHFRWTPTSEDKMLLAGSNRRSTEVPTDQIVEALAHPEWPVFRGPNRDGQEHGPIIAADWNANPPTQVWRIPVGPGWSSFSVAGPLLFTQEQRGKSETVVCYAADSGLEIWTRPVDARFEDPVGGPGPRATPTLADEALYVMGAQGHLLKLDPKSGEQKWQQDLRKVANREPPMWGFSSSPLVVDSVVIVHAGGKDDKGILAFSTDDGSLKWSAPSGDHSYSSPQLSTIDHERVVLMLTNAGLNVLDPATGEMRLNYAWPFDGYRALQPRVLEGDSILMASPMGAGTRRIRLSKSENQLKADEVWTTRNFKPDFNDLVVSQGFAYGYDGGIFACLNLENGKLAWKGGRYGKGQVLLQEESRLLIVMGEQGEVVLLSANPKELTELGRFQALTGKTWNHPVLIGDRLYLRNAEEAACYRLALATSAGAL